MRNAEVLAAIADPDFQTELGQFNIEINVPPRRLAGDENADLERDAAGQPQQRRGARPRGRRAHGDDRHPADPAPRAPDRWTRCRPTRATSCSTSRSSRPAARTWTSGSTASTGSPSPPTPSRPRRPAPAPSSTCRSARTQFAAYWNAAQVIAGVQVALGRQLAAAVRPGAVARDPDPAVRAGHRHPVGGDPGPGRTARGCGSASAGSPRCSTCSRRTSATSRRCCRSATTTTRPQILETRRHPGAQRAAPAQRHGLPLEPADLRGGQRPPAPAGGEPGAAGRPDGRRHGRQRARSTTAWSACWPRRSGRSGRQMSLQRRRGELPRLRPARHRRLGLLARPGLRAGDRAGAAPAAAAGPRGPGPVGRRPRPSATGCSASSSSAA